MKELLCIISIMFVFSCNNDESINTSDYSDTSSNIDNDTTFTNTNYGEEDLAPLKWICEIGGWIKSSPAIGDNNEIYIGGDSYHIFAVHSDGSIMWSLPIGTSDLLHDDYGMPIKTTVFSSPAIGIDNTIYISSLDNKLYSVNTQGTVNWEYTTYAWRHSPVIASEGTIYSGTDNALYALTPDGSLKWQFDVSGFITTSPSIGTDGTIYIGLSDSYLYALNPNGILKWKYQVDTSSSEALIYPVIGSEGIIYISSPKGKRLYAIYPDGALKWSFLTSGYIDTAPSIAEDGTIYVGSLDGNLYAIKPDGSLRWSYDLGVDYDIENTSAIGSDGTIYFGANVYNHGQIIALNPDGTLKWKYQANENAYFYSSPAIANDGTVYFASDDGYLYAFQTDSYGLANSPWPMFGHDARHTGRAGD